MLERAAGHGCGPYRVPNIDVEAIAVPTNNSVCGAFRGFGTNQAQFAMEGVIDRLADAVGISGWDIRNRNVVEPGDVWGPGQIMDDGAAGARTCPPSRSIVVEQPLLDRDRFDGAASYRRVDLAPDRVVLGILGEHGFAFVVEPEQIGRDTETHPCTNTLGAVDRYNHHIRTPLVEPLGRIIDPINLLLRCPSLPRW